jgi:transposase
MPLPPRNPARESRPWTHLSDAEWAALRPYVENLGAGRPIPDLRARMDAIFQAVMARGLPWSAFRSPYARTDTIHRHFRRLAHAGVWTTLLKKIARRRTPKPLRALTDWVCAAHRRAIRIIGLQGIVLARRLGLHRALPGPAWLLPDPDLSETMKQVQFAVLRNLDHPELRLRLRLLRRILLRIGRRGTIPRCLEPA